MQVLCLLAEDKVSLGLCLLQIGTLAAAREKGR